ncbi:MAG: hypothetical protein ACOVN4_13040 [Bosea sp. (in: a-proteobacteria)]
MLAGLGLAAVACVAGFGLHARTTWLKAEAGIARIEQLRIGVLDLKLEQARSQGRFLEFVHTPMEHLLDRLRSGLAQGIADTAALQARAPGGQIARQLAELRRLTVEALAEIKNPRPVAFVKQANVGTNVQVNNGPIGPYAGARVRENDADAPSGLLEASDGDRLDTRAQGAAGRGDPALEAVDAQHRPEDRER